MKTLVQSQILQLFPKGKSGFWSAILALFLGIFGLQFPFVPAQSVLFDFDAAPVFTPFPITQSAGGVTAYLSGTGQSYSIQEANALGFVPAGFAGHIVYPSSIYLSDLLVKFDQSLQDFSIMYSCQELGCDDAATMRVTAYFQGNFVGTNTMTATVPGTWPVDTLRCTFLQGFDSVVVHYDSHPPTCQDYGVIFLADNMRVTPLQSNAVLHPQRDLQANVFPNPVSQLANISFHLPAPQNVQIVLRDIQGRLVKLLADQPFSQGDQNIIWNADGLENGIYLLQLRGNDFSCSRRILVMR